MGEVKEMRPGLSEFSAALPAGVANLSQWAMRLNYDTGRVLALPAAVMVPAPVKALVSELSALVGVLAREVERLQAAGK